MEWGHKVDDCAAGESVRAALGGDAAEICAGCGAEVKCRDGMRFSQILSHLRLDSECLL